MNELGCGFLESVYHQSFIVALKQAGFTVQSEVPIKVFFRNVEVGFFRADLIINNQIIVEVKAVDSIIGEYKAQVINYLSATHLLVGLVINFGHPKVETARLIHPKTIQYSGCTLPN
jgi:GxxExxY protein